MRNTYCLVDKDSNELYGIFDSNLKPDDIEQIEKEATKKWDEKCNVLPKTEIFFDILKTRDPKYKISNVREVSF